MGPVSTTKASLRIFGDDLDPDEITRALGMPPTKARRKGEPFRNEGTGAEGIARRNGWWLDAEDRTPGDLDGQVRELLGVLTEDLSVWADISSRCQRLDMFCGLFLGEGNQGETLSPDTLQALGARNIELGLDIYGPEQG